MGLGLEVAGESALELLTPCKENLQGCYSHMEGSAKGQQTSLPLFSNPPASAGESYKGRQAGSCMEGLCGSGDGKLSVGSAVL